MACALWRFWRVHGHYSEGQEQLAAMLALSDGAEQTAQTGEHLADRSLSPNVKSVYAKALLGAGSMALEQGDYRAATPLLDKSLTLYRELEDSQGVALVLNISGIIAWNQRDANHAQVLYEESLVIRRELGDKHGIAGCLNNLGNIGLGQGDYSRARLLYEESLTIQRELGDKWGMAMSLGNLGLVAHEQGDYDHARELHKESLAIRQELGDKRGIAWCLEHLARDAAAQRKIAYAARLWGASEALREAIGAPLPPADQPEYERDLAAARALLDEGMFSQAWAEGRAMPLEEAIELCRRDAQELDHSSADMPGKAHTAPTSTHSQPNDLTRREIEVLRLVVDGLTNPEIAHRLSLSVHTVEAHLRSIFSKLGVTTRNAAAHYAHQNNLLA